MLAYIRAAQERCDMLVFASTGPARSTGASRCTTGGGVRGARRGADMIMGSHPHRLSNRELQGKPICQPG